MTWSRHTARTMGAGLLAAALALPACSASDTSTSPSGGGSTTAVASGTSVVEATVGDAVARPTVSGPVTGGTHGGPFNAMPASVAAEYDYLEEEFLISGEATAYAEEGTWGTDGRWDVTTASTAPYTTRMLVRRPKDPAAFDGTVMVEWLNVSSGQDADVEFAQAHDELLSHGSVWVGVSAQAVGVKGGGTAFDVPGVEATPLQTWDPERYAELSHPGDDYSYDIYSQVAAALVDPEGIDPLNGLTAQHLIGAGESQSAAHMVTYVNAVQPVAEAYDGFLIHSRSNGGSVLSAATTERPPYALIRDDLDVPVLQFQTETDIFGLESAKARQPDTDRLRTWEVAGTAHLDANLMAFLAAGAGVDTAAATAPIVAQCGGINEGPQHQVLNRAVADLRTWVVEGTPPATAEPIEIADGAIVRDELGIAQGGVRTPPVDAPTEVLSGENVTTGGYICSLFGNTTPLDAATLAARYPSHDAYVEAVTRSAEAAVAAGHLRDQDADAFIAAAEQSDVGGAAG